MVNSSNIHSVTWASSITSLSTCSACPDKYLWPSKSVSLQLAPASSKVCWLRNDLNQKVANWQISFIAVLLSGLIFCYSWTVFHRSYTETQCPLWWWLVVGLWGGDEIRDFIEESLPYLPFHPCEDREKRQPSKNQAASGLSPDTKSANTVILDFYSPALNEVNFYCL